MFEFYWKWFGLPLSNLKGWIVDSIPFSITELLLWVSLAATSLLLISAIRKVRISSSLLRTRPKYYSPFYWFSLIFLGPFILFLLIAGQSAIPLTPFPTALRTSLYDKNKPPVIDSLQFSEYISQAEKKLLEQFRWNHYISLTEGQILDYCNFAIESILKTQNLPQGRMVLKTKNMWGITRVMGLSYNGPAFHDPLTGEVAIADAKSLPTSHYWRLHAVCHETAHAKGFTREMDAEILTQLAFFQSLNPSINNLGLIMFLSKSGIKVEWPPELVEERKMAKEARNKTREKQWFISFIRKINRKLSIQNTGKKYGNRNRLEDWDIQHPFYTTVKALSPRGYFSDSTKMYRTNSEGHEQTPKKEKDENRIRL